MSQDFRLIHGDCYNVLPELISDGVKVDMIFADLPYGETGNVWDKKLYDFNLMFDYCEKLITDDGAILFNGSFKHGVTLFNTRPDLYKYEWIWEKENGTNVPSVNYQPFRVHEYIYVFGKGRVSYGKRTPMKYNPQKTKGKPYVLETATPSTNYKGGLNKIVTINNKGDRHPRTVQFFKRDKEKFHPTQKPIALLEYMIKTYTNPNDLVLDFTMGSGSTGVACRNIGRRFIGIELDENYYDIACDRIGDSYQCKLI